MASKSDKRQFPRAKERIPVQLSIDSGRKEFKALIYSTDISLTGIFFSSEFFLKVGTELDLSFTMPNDDRTVNARGVIVREVRLDSDKRTLNNKSGFAVRFTDYYADAKTILASSFLFAELDEFVRDFLTKRTNRPRNEEDQLREIIIAWEVSKIDLKGSELELIKDRLRFDNDGRIRRSSSHH